MAHRANVNFVMSALANFGMEQHVKHLKIFIVQRCMVPDMFLVTKDVKLAPQNGVNQEMV